MAQKELAVFANLCMVYDDQGRVLVQERCKPPWSGIAFPGGHVEPGESFRESVVREVYEETGLRILKVMAWPGRGCAGQARGGGFARPSPKAPGDGQCSPTGTPKTRAAFL